MLQCGIEETRTPPRDRRSRLGPIHARTQRYARLMSRRLKMKMTAPTVRTGQKSAKHCAEHAYNDISDAPSLRVRNA
jgi:hypothetical protein